ncbi:MAG TPA: [protein-PII] uridylyltransferase [Vitreimonas sp.]|nr:[protein-PII] uridylyltransferase [Vitreimonas sp.]
MVARLKPLSADQVVDGVQLRSALSAAFADQGEAARPIVLGLLRDALSRGRAVAESRLNEGENGLAVARLICGVTDEVVSALYDYTTVHMFRARNPTEGERFALLAVGGYGRGELAPYSDLDLLFLRAYKPTPFLESVTEYMLYMLWDLGLKVGHASRSIEESLKLARGDHTIQTAILDARLIAGDADLAANFQTRFRKEVAQRDHTGFIAAKLKERDERHLRAGASRYMVEPNLKEGKGGLRDLHTLYWMARHRYGFTRTKQYLAAGVFSPEEVATFRRATEFFWTVRCHLHFIAERAEERLTFDLQPEIAKRMGFGARGNHTAVERFMKRYFLFARQVGMLTRVLCARLEADHAKRAPLGLQRLLPTFPVLGKSLEPGFRIDGGRLNIQSKTTLNPPQNLIRLFEIAERNDLDVHPEALDEASRRARQMPPLWRKDEASRKAFLSIMASPRRPGAALRLMNEAGVLGKFVPEFGRIVAQMQFNMYHHYTVDEHTLRAVDAISDIEKGRYKGEHPLSTEIFPKIINRRALFLAMLLHDTGKGEGDQQIEGEKAAHAACERLGLPADEVELVGWLVRHHLVMSDYAQKRDIGDPSTVMQFAEIVGSVERLRLLLVLTVADIRAVSSNVWNDWKGQLLRDLYRLTEATLHGGRSDEESVRAHLAEMAGEAKEKLRQSEKPDPELDDWLASLEDAYWLSHDMDALSWHAREVLQACEARAIPHVAARVRPERGITEVIIYAGDRPGLFASLCAAITASGGDIASARAYTTRDKGAFDVFFVQTPDRRAFGGGNPGLMEAMTSRLTRAALEDMPTPAPQPMSRRARAFAIEPWVRLDNDVTPLATIVEASGRDRPGLLAELAKAISTEGLTISSAHIDTYGERASDVFYVQDEEGAQILAEERGAALKAALQSVLRAVETAAPADSADRPLAVAQASTAR